MIDYLSGVSNWLLRRAHLLHEKLLNFTDIGVPSSADIGIESFLERQILYLEKKIGEIEALKEELKVSDQKYSGQYLTKLRTLVRYIDELETDVLPLIEFWEEDSERLQTLISKLCRELGFSRSIKPIVALYSFSYFFVNPLGIIFLPRLEGNFLLHLPDLYHELAHLVFREHQYELLPSAEDKIKEHYDRLHLKGKMQHDPLASDFTYERLSNIWLKAWLQEFTCDLIATFLCGPAYVWSHLHLCASKQGSFFFPSAGDLASHPADEARWRIMSLALTDMGYHKERKAIQNYWESLLSTLQEKEPTNFHRAYPNELMNVVKEEVKQGLNSLKIKKYCDVPMNEKSFAKLLNEAWARFWQDPKTYTEWEQKNNPLS